MFSRRYGDRKCTAGDGIRGGRRHEVKHGQNNCGCLFRGVNIHDTPAGAAFLFRGLMKDEIVPREAGDLEG